MRKEDRKEARAGAKLYCFINKSKVNVHLKRNSTKTISEKRNVNVIPVSI